MDAESQLLADLEAEIERLKAYAHQLFGKGQDKDEEIERLKQLITELTQALDGTASPWALYQPLIQRAREATR
jgi:peptidoglycan hydrolase CwlO-like protein